MKVRVSEIPEEGLTLSEKIDPNQMHLDTPDLKFAQDLLVTAEFQRHEGAVWVQVGIRGEQEQICSRCLEHYGRPYERQFQLGYSVKDRIVLDVTEDIRQEIFLSYSVQYLCRQDCQGLCATCGQNLNERRCAHGSA